MLHRSRRRLVGQRTALVNQTRGFLHEYGIVMAKGVSSVRRRVPEILEDATNELTSLTQKLVAELYDELCALDERVEGFEMRLKAQFRDNSMCQRLAKVEGICPVSATALVATVAMPRCSTVDADWLPGWVWYRSKPPPEADLDWEVLANAGTVIYVHYSSTVRAA